MSPGCRTGTGSTLTEQITQCGDPIKAMYILGLNPVVSYPDSNHVMRSLEKLDFLVVQDIFPTETTKYADVILPGACFAEKDGTFTSGERRINRIRKAVNPPGDAKADCGYLCHARKEDGTQGLRLQVGRGCLERHAGGHPVDVRCDLPEDGEAGVRALALSDRGAPGDSYPAQGEVRGRRTASGTFFGIEYRPPAEVADAEYPFTLMTGRLIFHYHTRTQTGRSKVLDYEVPEGYVQINVEDAKRLGIKERGEDQAPQPPRGVDPGCTDHRRCGARAS